MPDVPVPGDFEDLVRRSLRARAADVPPDPHAWERVQARLRRRRWWSRGPWRRRRTPRRPPAEAGEE